jgi:hypothetical protein
LLKIASPKSYQNALCFICLFLQDAITANGDLGKRITYLKVDVEGSELKSISEWITSGILDDVRQIGIEIHTARDFVVQEQVEKNQLTNHYEFKLPLVYRRFLLKQTVNKTYLSEENIFSQHLRRKKNSTLIIFITLRQFERQFYHQNELFCKKGVLPIQLSNCHDF